MNEDDKPLVSSDDSLNDDHLRAEQSTPPPAASVISPDSSQPTTPAVTPAPHRRRKKLLLAVGIVLVIVILGGAAAAAYVGYYLPTRPANMVDEALVNTLFNGKLSSTHMTGHLTAKGDNTQMSLDMNGNLSRTATDLTLTAHQEQLKVSVELKGVDKTLYFRLSGLDAATFSKAAGVGGDADTQALVGIYGQIVSQFNDKWISVDQDMISELTHNKVDFSQKLSDADVRKIEDLYKQHHFLHVQQVYADQTIGGLDSVHYKMTIDKQQLHDFLAGVQKADIKNLDINQTALDAINKADISKSPFDLWIAKKDKLIDQFSMPFTSKQGSGSVTMTFTNFNKPVSVTRPADATPLLELFRSALSGPAGQSLLEGLGAGASAGTSTQIQTQ